MQKKPSGFVYADTHAGAGGYPLASAEGTVRPAEYERGFSLLLQQDRDTLPPAVKALLDIVIERASGTGQLVYPGSALIAASLSRDQDSLLLCEKARDQFELLESCIGKGRATLIQGDGYKALRRSEQAQADVQHT